MGRLANSPSVHHRIEFWGIKNKVATRIASIPLNANRVELQKEALRWSYIVRQRGRWSQDWNTQSEIGELALESLENLGIDEHAIQGIGGSTPVTFSNRDDLQYNVIEVRIPWVDEANWWEARVMPWEHLLAAATRGVRGETPILVTRVLHRKKRPFKKGSKAEQVQVPLKFGLVTVSPGNTLSKNSFASEIESVSQSIKPISQQQFLETPTESELKQWLCDWEPNVLHLSGIDTRRAVQLLGLPDSNLHDGLAIRDANAHCDLLFPMKTAELLAGGTHCPSFIGLNLWDSAARIAPLTISLGVRQVLSFENAFDDSLAELFFRSFYERWSSNQWNTLEAFAHGVAATRPYARRVRGGGFVLWSDESLLDRLADEMPNESKVETQKSKRVTKPLTRDQNIRDWVSVEVEVEPEINYALLHNRQSLLRKLILRMKKTEGTEQVDTIHDIEAKIRLYFGNESFPFTTRVGLSSQESTVNLADPLMEPSELHGPGGIHVPLLSSLPRSLDESVLTSLEVEVRWEDQILHHRTYPVRLAPIDQWRFEERDIIWLPSFIYPRDRVVAEIVHSAQRYLTCLRDDTTAGFDGYAAYRTDLEGVDRWKGIEDQARAIWSAILIDYRLRYINPPPSYSTASQRLRTPSQTVDQGRGTCIDLALLLAACMEWIDLYPVIFLTEDHAFPGYWRDLESYNNFTEPKILKRKMQEGPRSSHSESSSQNPSAMTFPWYNSRSTYLEIRELIQNGSLVPIESVCLTNAEGFSTARTVAEEYFQSRHPHSFQSMIDVARARLFQVTPLPV